GGGGGGGRGWGGGSGRRWARGPGRYRRRASGQLSVVGQEEAVAIHGAHGDRLETRRPHDHELDLLARRAEPEAAIEVGLARHLLAVHAHDHVAGAEAGHARRTDGAHAGDHEPAVRLPRGEAEPRAWPPAFP